MCCGGLFSVLLSLQRTTEYPLIFELLRKNWKITFSWCWWHARVNKKKQEFWGMESIQRLEPVKIPLQSLCLFCLMMICSSSPHHLTLLPLLRKISIFKPHQLFIVDSGLHLIHHIGACCFWNLTQTNSKPKRLTSIFHFMLCLSTPIQKIFQKFDHKKKKKQQQKKRWTQEKKNKKNINKTRIRTLDLWVMSPMCYRYTILFFAWRSWCEPTKSMWRPILIVTQLLKEGSQQKRKTPKKDLNLGLASLSCF